MLRSECGWEGSQGEPGGAALRLGVLTASTIILLAAGLTLSKGYFRFFRKSKDPLWISFSE